MSRLYIFSSNQVASAWRFFGWAVFRVAAYALLTVGMWCAGMSWLYWWHNRDYVSDPKGIYVWGDSRIYQGLDLEMIRQATGRTVAGFGQHAASVYDFAVFADLAPKGSTILVGTGFSALVRNYWQDNSRIGFSWRGELLLIRAGFPWGVIWRNVRVNLSPFKSTYRSQSPVYPNRDELIYPELMDQYKSHYLGAKEETSLVLQQKMWVLDKVLSFLASKDCQVTVIDYPIHPTLQEIADNSEFKDFPENLKKLERPGLRVLTHVPLRSAENIFNDVSHLNQRGRDLMTRWVLKEVFGIDWTQPSPTGK